MSRPVPAMRSWRTRGEAWEPGDPLYVHPHDDYRNTYSQCVREMYQIINTGAGGRWAIMQETNHCPKCLVAWDGAVLGPLCWVCGSQGKRPRYS